MPRLPFGVTFVTNESPQSTAVVALRKPPFAPLQDPEPLGLARPPGVLSLSHVAVPFSPEDPAASGPHCDRSDFLARPDGVLLGPSPAVSRKQAVAASAPGQEAVRVLPRRPATLPPWPEPLRSRAASSRWIQRRVGSVASTPAAPAPWPRGAESPACGRRSPSLDLQSPEGVGDGAKTSRHSSPPVPESAWTVDDPEALRAAERARVRAFAAGLSSDVEVDEGDLEQLRVLGYVE